MRIRRFRGKPVWDVGKLQSRMKRGEDRILLTLHLVSKLR